MISVGSTAPYTSKVPCLCLGDSIFPLRLFRCAVETSTRRRFTPCNIAKSQGQLGLSARKTAYPLLRRSAATRNSPIVPTVDDVICLPEGVRLDEIGLARRYKVLANSLLHSREQVLAWRGLPCLPGRVNSNALPHVKQSTYP